MKYISLDTNAILDFCYRTYPEKTFPKLWELVDSLVLSRAIKLHVCSSVLEETTDKIETFEYDLEILNLFLERYFVQTIEKDDVGNHIIDIRKMLIKYPFSANSPHATSDEPDVDLIAIAKYLGANSIVITGEIGFIGNNWDNFIGNRKTRIKIPDICCLTKIQSCSWSSLFESFNLVV
ncbi:DUF4411 family protein [Acinetobacter sp. V102_4]|uniref:DUF4411 family protein n=1 Tax=Acinetobacter sp. V102_4 TaxID=3072984 RepID=UPI00287DACB7|nr:DUF4411 family protein [Acinetobacter sp. V102_4]MDS7931877.1 DUF4411 family protein [Acinetobacter sp. V102_4]